MMRRIAVYALLLAWAGTVPGWGVDVSPSRRVVPDKFVDPPGKRYSIFAGDPERVQRANEINLEDFSATLSLEPETLTLSDAGRTEGLVIRFEVTNTSKRSYTLSFPDAQRFDYALVTPNDELVYLWSKDKVFVQQTGMSFINGGEKLVFSETLELERLKSLVVPGTYTVVMILSNYPEIKAAQVLKVAP